MWSELHPQLYGLPPDRDSQIILSSSLNRSSKEVHHISRVSGARILSLSRRLCPHRLLYSCRHSCS